MLHYATPVLGLPTIILEFLSPEKWGSQTMLLFEVYYLPIFFFKFFRHGDRTPIHLIPNDKNTEDEWPEGLGQLTTVSILICSVF